MFVFLDDGLNRRQHGAEIAAKTFFFIIRFFFCPVHLGGHFCRERDGPKEAEYGFFCVFFFPSATPGKVFFQQDVFWPSARIELRVKEREREG